jgi:hypothetical protein
MTVVPRLSYVKRLTPLKNVLVERYCDPGAAHERNRKSGCDIQQYQFVSLLACLGRLDVTGKIPAHARNLRHALDRYNPRLDPHRESSNPTDRSVAENVFELVTVTPG